MMTQPQVPPKRVVYLPRPIELQLQACIGQIHTQHILVETTSPQPDTQNVLMCICICAQGAHYVLGYEPCSCQHYSILCCQPDFQSNLFKNKIQKLVFCWNHGFVIFEYCFVRRIDFTENLS